MFHKGNVLSVNVKIFHAVMIIVVALFALSSGGCKKKDVKAKEERAVNIQVLAVEKKPLRPFIEAIGTLKPFDEVTVSAEINGILKKANVDEASPVAKGTLLALIDDTDLALEVKKAEATLSQASATLENTKLEYGRKEALYKESLVTKQQLDDVSARLSVAQADVEKAEVSLLLARHNLSKARILSPISGVIESKKVSPGDYIKNGTELFTIIKNDPIKLSFSVPEKDVVKLKKGQEVRLTLDSFPDGDFRGKLDIIYPSLDEKTRTLQLEALIPNPDGILKPGLFAKAALYVGEQKDTVVVPVNAILYEGETVKVFVAENDRAREKKVKLGGKYGEVVEIKEGLGGGETLIVVGQQNLSDGVKVNVAR